MSECYCVRCVSGRQAEALSSLQQRQGLGQWLQGMQCKKDVAPKPAPQAENMNRDKIVRDYLLNEDREWMGSIQKIYNDICNAELEFIDNDWAPMLMDSTIEVGKDWEGFQAPEEKK